MALREVQRQLSDARVLGGIAIVTVILGFSGPFGTFESLDVADRLVYWGAVAFISYAVALTTGSLLRHWFGDRLQRPVPRVVVIGLIAALPVAAAILVVNLVTFGPERGWQVIALPALWLNATLITMGVMTISTIVRGSTQAPRAIAAPPPAPALLDRLPLPQRGTLMSLSVTDHYVEVTTSRGRSLVLMRLSDAIREAAPIAGIQIHRSHWVALDAVARTLRVEGKLVVELKDGRRLPVSRGYAAEVRAAGLVA
ncbi:MAG TPA: LytTR family DNA-binding domain-containing protein [Devosia sp.]